MWDRKGLRVCSGQSTAGLFPGKHSSETLALGELQTAWPGHLIEGVGPYQGAAGDLHWQSPCRRTGDHRKTDPVLLGKFAWYFRASYHERKLGVRPEKPPERRGSNLKPCCKSTFFLHMQYCHSQTENVTTGLLDLFHEMNATFLPENKAC